MIAAARRHGLIMLINGDSTWFDKCWWRTDPSLLASHGLAASYDSIV